MSRDLSTPSDRIRWAVQNSGKRLVDIAEAIGCSHSALSQWQNGHTHVENIKVGLLLGFCRETGASIQWILTGDGPRMSTYGSPHPEPPLVVMAAHIAHDMPAETVALAERMLIALEPAAPNLKR